MATRVRKLAKELDRSPLAVLGLLHALGFERYKSPEDMVPDNLIEKVTRAVHDGVAPVPVAVTGVARPAPPPRPAKPDLMSALVPGVVPTGRPAPAPRRAPPEDVPLKQLAAPEPNRSGTAHAAEVTAVEAARAAIEADRHALRAEREALADRLVALEASLAREAAARREAAEERAALAAERAALVAEREAAATRRPPAVPLMDVLEARGLRGRDEMERALGALAERRALADLIPTLCLEDPQAASRVFGTLVLVGGAPPPSLSPRLAPVQVAEDRAELPGWDTLRRSLERLGETLMLHGLRRLIVAGGRPEWQRLLREGVDPRVELRFVAPDAVSPEATDTVVYWGVRPPGSPHRGRAIVARGTLPDLVAGVISALES